MINVLYTCAALGSSGYSESSRNYIAALNTQSGINLAVESATFEMFKTDQSKYEELLQPLINKTITPDVQIVHMTPENYPKYKKPNMKNIGYTVWETTQLPDTWVPFCNMMDEIWVPCDWNVEVFKSSGVTVPVKKVPHTIDLEQFENVEPIKLGIPRDKFKFYSIFQWTDRKHPYGLIKAYLSEFSAQDNVALICKTYRMNHTPQDKSLIEREIQSLKAFANTKNLPTVYLIHEALSRDDILGLHALGDCFVLPHKSEGWGLAPFESMASGKPTISTNFGGNLEFMNDDNSYLIDYTLTPVSNMPWPIYNIKQSWAEPDLSDLKAKMRYVYENRNASDEKIKNAKISVAKYSWQIIGELMKKNLTELFQVEKK